MVSVDDGLTVHQEGKQPVAQDSELGGLSMKFRGFQIHGVN